MWTKATGLLTGVGALVFTLVLTHGAMTAHDLDDAQRWYRDGDFDRAAESALDAHTAAGLALAARSMLAFAAMSTSGEKREAHIALAENYARRAIASDPDYLEGHLELAIALGYLGRGKGPVAAYFAGMADEARERLDFVLERAPDNVWGHAIMGAWHLEIVRSTGKWMARQLYGASQDAGIAHFEKAVELAPDNPVIHIQFAVQLLDLDAEKHRDRGLGLLVQAGAIAPKTAYEAFVLHQAGDLKAALEAGDERRVDTLICEIQGDCVVTIGRDDG